MADVGISAHAASQTLVSFRVVVDQRVCLNWYILPVFDGPNFDWALENLRVASKNGTGGGGRFSRVIDNSWILSRLYVSQDATAGQRLDVSPLVPVAEACRTFGRFVTFEFAEPAAKASSVEPVNAFAVMMQSASAQAQSLVLPGKRPESRADWRLFNALIEDLEKGGLGFSVGSRLAETSGKEFLDVLATVLFQVLVPERIERMEARGIKLPARWTKLLEGGVSFNEPKAHKHGLRALTKEMIIEWRDMLYRVLLFPWLGKEKWKGIAQATRDVASCLHKYAGHLESSTQRMNAMHNMLEPARCPGDGTSSELRRIESAPRQEKLMCRYRSLEKALASRDEYGDPLFLLDYAPTDRQDRYEYIHDLQMPFAVEIFRYHQGGNRGTLSWIWKAPNDPAQSDNSKSSALVNSLLQAVPVYHTRAMRQEFVHRYGLISRVSPSVLNEMYQYLSDDASVLPSSVSQAVQARLRLALELQDPDLVFDLRELNEGRHVKYDRFYEAAQAYIERNALQAADDRRHGSTCHMALAMSVRDFRDRVAETLPEGTPAPSAKWLAFQFQPKNPYHASAAQYTGRLNVRFLVQARQLHHDHVDGHYAAAIFCYMRELSVQLKNRCTLVSMDDKHNIKVGEPGYPVAALDRGKQVIVGQGQPVKVADHDFTKAKLTPSVVLVHSIPDSIDQSFYQGKVYVTIKDSIFQASSPLRHAAELSGILQREVNFILKPVLLVYSDGGPDHRVTYVSVKAAIIALFLKHNLDLLVAARTAPNQSYRNPVERIMSVLNLPLQGVGLMRQAMSDDMERVMKRINSMKDIRSSAQSTPALRAAFTASLQPCKDLLSSLVERLRLHDEKMTSYHPATEEDISDMWAEVQRIEPDLQQGDTTAVKVKDKAAFKQFLSKHMVSRHYFISLKKCGEPSCSVCQPFTLPEEEVKRLHHFPDPMLQKNSDHFQAFSSVYGKSTTEKDRPSLKAGATGRRVEKPPFILKSERVRRAIACTDCDRPRCVYSEKKLSQDAHNELDKVEEDYEYVCGNPLLPEDHSLHNLVVAEHDITCNSFVSAKYFSANICLPSCCYVCGSQDHLVDASQLSGQFQIVHPVCESCTKAGHFPRTRGPKRSSSQSAPGAKKKRH